MREVKRDFPWFSITEYEKEAAYLRRRLDTPTAKAGGFLFLPPLH